MANSIGVSIYVGLNVVGAIFAVWVMQFRTGGTRHGALVWLHRVTLGGLAIILCWNAANVVEAGTLPRWSGIGVNLMYFLVTVMSSVRHAAARNPY